MRILFLQVLLLIGATAISSNLHAATQGAPPPKALDRENRMLSSLSPADRDKFIAARTKALADNPALKTEADDLMKQGKDLRSGDATPQDKQAFVQKMMTHMQKMRQAMLKEDPSLRPIFEQLDKQWSQMKAKREGQNSQPTGATNAPSATPPPAK